MTVIAVQISVIIDKIFLAFHVWHWFCDLNKKWVLPFYKKQLLGCLGPDWDPLNQVASFGSVKTTPGDELRFIVSPARLVVSLNCSASRKTRANVSVNSTILRPETHLSLNHVKRAFFCSSFKRELQSTIFFVLSI